MILKDDVAFAQVIYERLKNLYLETKNPECSDFVMKTELTEILIDVQELNAALYKRWRDVR